VFSFTVFVICVLQFLVSFAIRIVGLDAAFGVKDSDNPVILQAYRWLYAHCMVGILGLIAKYFSFIIKLDRDVTATPGEKHVDLIRKLMNAFEFCWAIYGWIGVLNVHGKEIETLDPTFYMRFVIVYYFYIASVCAFIILSIGFKAMDFIYGKAKNEEAQQEGDPQDQPTARRFQSANSAVETDASEPIENPAACENV